MSQIINKVYDATKKIVRSVFKGSPNLFTTADLNRQFEAIKYQLDLLDNKTGFITDINLSSATLSNGVLSVTPTFTTIKCRGCDFSPESSKLQIDITSKPAYLALIVKTSLITYTDDPTHEIAGAKFADGTSQPAANQLVYTDERLALVYRGHKCADDETLVGVIAMFQKTSQGTLVVKKNYITDITDVIAFRTENNVINSDSTSTGNITPGTSYDQAINILQNRLNNLKNPLQSTWIDLLRNETATENVQCKITNGVMYLRIRQHEYEVKTTQGGHGTVYTFVRFPTALKNALISYFNDLNIADAEISPYGSFGTCYLVNSTTALSGGAYKYSGNVMEIWTLCLVLEGNQVGGLNSSSVNLQDVGVGVMQSMEVDLQNSAVKEIDYLNGSLGPNVKGMLVVPEMTVAIPLPGLKW